MSLTPKSLLLRLRRTDDEDAWEQMVAVYGPLLRQWLHNHGIADADADDLAQDVLVVVCRQIPEFERSGKVGAFRNWLKTIVLNRTREFWRRGRLRPVVVDGNSLLEQLADPHSSLSSWWDREHDCQVARRLLARIRPEFSTSVWDMFRLVVLEGHTGAQAAERSGASLASVYAAKSRVLSRLRSEAADLIDLE